MCALSGTGKAEKCAPASKNGLAGLMPDSAQAKAICNGKQPSQDAKKVCSCEAAVTKKCSTKSKPAGLKNLDPTSEAAKKKCKAGEDVTMDSTGVCSCKKGLFVCLTCHVC